MSDKNITKPTNVVDLKTAIRTVTKGGKCPLCAKPTVDAFKPFCSKRCANLDLGKWLGDGYRLPTDEGPGSGEDGQGED